MFSKELAELDRNTTEFMIDRMQKEIDQQAEELKEKDRIMLNCRQLMRDLKRENLVEIKVSSLRKSELFLQFALLHICSIPFYASPTLLSQSRRLPPLQGRH